MTKLVKYLLNMINHKFERMIFMFLITSRFKHRKLCLITFKYLVNYIEWTVNEFQLCCTLLFISKNDIFYLNFKSNTSIFFTYK